MIFQLAWICVDLYVCNSGVCFDTADAMALLMSLHAFKYQRHEILINQIMVEFDWWSNGVFLNKSQNWSSINIIKD